MTCGRQASTPLTTESHWGPICGSDLYWASWDSEEVLYHAGSGDTHLLDKHTALLLKRMQQSPATSSQLAQFFAEMLGIECDDHVLTRVEKTLECLLRLSLIQPLST